MGEISTGQLNRKKLESIFNINTTIENGLQTIQEVRSDLELPEENIGYVSDTLKNSIDRANRILDLLEEELKGGNLTAKMVEASAKMIESITNATQTLATFDDSPIETAIKVAHINLKKEELEYKKSSGNTNQKGDNILICTTNDLLNKFTNKITEETQ